MVSHGTAQGKGIVRRESISGTPEKPACRLAKELLTNTGDVGGPSRAHSNAESGGKCLSSTDVVEGVDIGIEMKNVTCFVIKGGQTCPCICVGGL